MRITRRRDKEPVWGLFPATGTIANVQKIDTREMVRYIDHHGNPPPAYRSVEDLEILGSLFQLRVEKTT
jgi:hypothetical protein